MQSLDLNPLVKWFLIHRRNLPWRDNPSPYAVWISETMLQQTQVKTVIPYFEKWMETFPDLKTLAQAREEQVIKLWEGLGYYSRARNLHAAAKYCCDHFNGQIPSDPEKLKQLKGIGPYTLGAIQSFAFHQKAPAVDGNVTRVLSRLTGYDKAVDTQSAKKEFEALLMQSLPDDAPWMAMEGLIELGALVCKKTPLCTSCPFINTCKAFKTGDETRLPIKRKAPPPTHLTRHALILSSVESVVLKQGEKGEVMEGLWEFPYFENHLPESAFGFSLKEAEPIGIVSHTFTRYKVTLHGWSLKVPKINPETLEETSYIAIPCEKLGSLPFSSGMRRLVHRFKNF